MIQLPAHAALFEEQPPVSSVTHCRCGTKLGVIDSRTVTINGMQTIWRRRKCQSCGSLFKTLELSEALALDVLSDD